MKILHTTLIDLLAPGTNRVTNFEIPVKLAPNKDGIQVDWEGFKNSKKVKAQLEALSKIKI
jgi:hypothetical protein